MRALLLIAIIATTFAVDAGHGARAQWCAYYDAYTYNCGFRTFQQCLATISGVGGWCRPDQRGPESSERRRGNDRRDWDRERGRRY